MKGEDGGWLSVCAEIQRLRIDGGNEEYYRRCSRCVRVYIGAAVSSSDFCVCLVVQEAKLNGSCCNRTASSADEDAILLLIFCPLILERVEERLITVDDGVMRV